MLTCDIIFSLVNVHCQEYLPKVVLSVFAYASWSTLKYWSVEMHMYVSVYVQNSHMSMHTYIYRYINNIHKYRPLNIHIPRKLWGNEDCFSFLLFPLPSGTVPAVTRVGNVCSVVALEFSADLFKDLYSLLFQCRGRLQGRSVCWSCRCAFCSLCPQAWFKTYSGYPALAQALLILRAIFIFKQEQTKSVFERNVGTASCGISLSGLICWSWRNQEPSFMFSLLSQVKWKPDLTAKCHLWEFCCVISIWK